jgi:hypothetical protein
VASRATQHALTHLTHARPLTKTCQLFMPFLSNYERQFPVTHDEVRRYLGHDLADKPMLELCTIDDLLQRLESRLLASEIISFSLPTRAPRLVCHPCGPSSQPWPCHGWAATAAPLMGRSRRSGSPARTPCFLSPHCQCVQQATPHVSVRDAASARRSAIPAAPVAATSESLSLHPPQSRWYRAQSCPQSWVSG